MSLNVGPLIPPFWTSDVSSGFHQNGSLACATAPVYNEFLPVVRHLLTSRQPTWKGEANLILIPGYMYVFFLFCIRLAELVELGEFN